MDKNQSVEARRSPRRGDSEKWMQPPASWRTDAAHDVRVHSIVDLWVSGRAGAPLVGKLSDFGRRVIRGKTEGYSELLWAEAEDAHILNYEQGRCKHAERGRFLDDSIAINSLPIRTWRSTGTVDIKILAAV